jgi:hypothetical protein
MIRKRGKRIIYTRHVMRNLLNDKLDIDSEIQMTKKEENLQNIFL